MKDNIQNILKRDLEIIPLGAYFMFYFLYLLFDRILEQKDYAMLVKPIIIPIIAFLYLTNKNSKKNILSIFLLFLIFISDNSVLLEIRTFHIYTTLIYLLCIGFLLFYALSDWKYFEANKSNKRILVITLTVLLVFSLIFLITNYNFTDKKAEKFVAYEYMLIFLVVFLVSLFNFILQKSKKTKYLFLTILSLFLSDLCFSIHHYYNGNIIFVYFTCIVEIPVYYFLLKYLLIKDKEFIEQ